MTSQARSADRERRRSYRELELHLVRVELELLWLKRFTAALLALQGTTAGAHFIEWLAV